MYFVDFDKVIERKETTPERKSCWLARQRYRLTIGTIAMADGLYYRDTLV